MKRVLEEVGETITSSVFKCIDLAEAERLGSIVWVLREYGGFIEMKLPDWALNSINFARLRGGGGAGPSCLLSLFSSGTISCQADSHWHVYVV